MRRRARRFGGDDGLQHLGHGQSRIGMACDPRLARQRGGLAQMGIQAGGDQICQGIGGGEGIDGAVGKVPDIKLGSTVPRSCRAIVGQQDDHLGLQAVRLPRADIEVDQIARPHHMAIGVDANLIAIARLAAARPLACSAGLRRRCIRSMTWLASPNKARGNSAFSAAQ